MRVVQANKAYPPHIGGIETVVKQLAEGVAARSEHVSRVVVCNDGPETSRQEENGVSITRAGSVARVSSLPISPSYASHLLSETADVLTIHEPSLLASMAYVANTRRARRRFQRLVVWWHSDIVRQRVMAPLFVPLFHRILDCADAICVATPNHIGTSMILPGFSDKCHVVPFGIDPERFRLTPEMEQRVEDTRSRFGGPIVLFTGRLVYYKGVDYLIRAMEGLPDAHLVVVGGGPLGEKMRTLAASMRIRISFVSDLTNDEMTAMYHAADIFVLPSVENSEAFGIVQIEAMACGKPVITTDLKTGVTFVNQDGVTGLVVPARNVGALNDAIRTLLADEGMRATMGEAARSRVLEHFTLQGMVDSTLAVYNSVLDGSGS